MTSQVHGIADVLALAAIVLLVVTELDSVASFAWQCSGTVATKLIRSYARLSHP